VSIVRQECKKISADIHLLFNHLGKIVLIKQAVQYRHGLERHLVAGNLEVRGDQSSLTFPQTATGFG
jgi:hypothetical protein